MFWSFSRWIKANFAEQISLCAVCRLCLPNPGSWDVVVKSSNLWISWKQAAEPLWWLSCLDCKVIVTLQPFAAHLLCSSKLCWGGCRTQFTSRWQTWWKMRGLPHYIICINLYLHLCPDTKHQNDLQLAGNNCIVTKTSTSGNHRTVL